MERSLNSELLVDAQQQKKCEYVAPQLTKYGSVAQLTQGITGRYYDTGAKAVASSGRPTP